MVELKLPSQGSMENISAVLDTDNVLLKTSISPNSTPGDMIYGTSLISKNGKEIGCIENKNPAEIAKKLDINPKRIDLTA